jgi:hypothetical protein
MRLLRPGRWRIALVGVAMALGLMTVLASAGTAATAATNSPQHALTQTTAVHTVASPRGHQSAGLRGALCSSSTAHWFTLHIYWDGGNWEYFCYGYQGSWSGPDDNQFVWACAGNNYGTFGYQLSNGKEYKINFGPGWSKSFPQGTLFQSLSISKWSGSYNC